MSAVKPRKFAGTNDDVLLFLDDFEHCARFHNWKDQKRLAAIPMLLADYTRHWYANLDPTSFTSYDELKNLMLKYFSSESSKLVL